MPVVVWTLIGVAIAFLHQVSLGPRGLQVFLHQHALVPGTTLTNAASHRGRSPTQPVATVTHKVPFK